MYVLFQYLKVQIAICPSRVLSSSESSDQPKAHEFDLVSDRAVAQSFITQKSD